MPIDTSKGLYGGLWKSASGGAKSALAKATAADRAKGGQGLSNQQRRDFLSNYAGTDQMGGAGGGGAGGAGGGGGGSPTSAGGMAQGMWDVAGGFMDPDSDFFQQMMQRQRQAMGAQTAGQQRSAALAGAEGGFGGGASPEMMQMQAQYGAAGTEALGGALTDLQLAAPQLGLQYGQVAGGLQMGQQGQDIQQKQFGQTFGEGQRQFDVGTGLTQQQMANQSGQFAQQHSLAQAQAKQQAQYNQQQLGLQAAGQGLNFGGGGGGGVPSTWGGSPSGSAGIGWA